MKTNAELIKWLRDNSSGVYRPSNEVADRLADALYVIRGILTDLPQNRDWLNPELERAAKLLISLDNDERMHPYQRGRTSNTIVVL